MDYPFIAIAHIDFPTKKFQDKDMQPVESLLRNNGNIYHVMVHDKRLTFYMWGEIKINFDILEVLKEELKKRQYTDFMMSAGEYVQTGQKYYFDAKSS